MTSRLVVTCVLWLDCICVHIRHVTGIAQVESRMNSTWNIADSPASGGPVNYWCIAICRAGCSAGVCSALDTELLTGLVRGRVFLRLGPGIVSWVCCSYWKC
jgi:hypothetical protein